ncbi:hypothetical protein P9A14_02575 [Gordonia hongkongensis]|uniref:Uncharacterized protein n=1 Tax=Gordonia hongkongensis TaxID=1701090 RepID=A0AAX3T903_9ACTN|nr:hypothetical protein [Gordonia hongkongensis]QIK49639.1 hypothetical protein G8C36_22165 [Gordonia terrae]WFP25429.1 hypothetical protein P9A14_02575 [Gordonia hongkongensis]
MSLATTTSQSTNTEYQVITSAAFERARRLGVQVHIPANVRSAQQVHAALDHGESDVEKIVTFSRGRVCAVVERHDYLESDGSPEPSSVVVALSIPPTDVDYLLDKHTIGFGSDEGGRIGALGDVAAVTTAVTRFLRAYVATSSAVIEVL